MAHAPDPRIVNATEICRGSPEVASPPPFAAQLSPELIGPRRIPGWHVDTIGDVTNGHFSFRKSREQRLKQTAANVSMQAAHGVCRPATPNREVGHIEWLRIISPVHAAECKQIKHGNAEQILRIPRHMLT